MAVLGVDVSLGRGLDVALVEDGLVKGWWSAVGAARLSELLRELRPRAVGIDSPPSKGLGLLRHEAERARLPVPPAPGKHVARRVAEYELSRRGIGSHQTHFDETRLFSWMTAGFEAFRAAEAAGFAPYLGEGSPHGGALEVFPYASYVTLAGCLSPGRRWRLAWRRSVLEEAGVRGLPEDAAIDLVDAACAAFTAERFLSGDGTAVGDPREGAIVLPVRDLLDRYRRCPALEPSARRPEASRLCECGCGRPVRRRFLPGHDSKLKSRLLREARAGDAARAELARLGWSKFVERE
jgi:predicted nuclease with RNAse H fold